MKNSVKLLCAGLLSTLAVSCASVLEKKNYPFPTPTPNQLVWQEAELGALVCYDLHTFNEGRYIQKKARVTPIKNADQFNPANLDTDQWVKAAKDAGCTFAILTVSHESGFRLWQSEVNPFCLKAVKWGEGKRDVAREFVDSCRKYGLKPGFFIGTRWNGQLGIYDFKVTERATITQKEYNKLIEDEVKELCTNYGELFEFWFDGGAYGPEQGGPDVLSIVEKYQPKTHFYHNLQRADSRWGGSETGTVSYPCWATFPYHCTGAGDTARKNIYKNNYRLLKSGDPNGKFWVPAMSDYPLRGNGGHEWFWEPGDERLIMPLHKMIDKYYKSVGRNTTLYIGVTPDTSGVIPAADTKRLKEFGDFLKSVYDNKVAETKGEGKEVVLDLDGTKEFDHLMIQEDILHGERVREYRVEILKDGKWSKLASGSCIGHKRIHVFKEKVKAEKVRLTVDKSIAEPMVKSLTVYNKK